MRHQLTGNQGRYQESPLYSFRGEPPAILNEKGDEEVMEDILDCYQEKLMQIFQYYCSYGEPMNTSKLKSSKFIKILKDAGALQAKKSDENRSVNTNKQVSQVDADLIYSKLTGLKPSAKQQP